MRTRLASSRRGETKIWYLFVRLESLLRLRHRVANANAANARLHVSPPPEHGGQTGGGVLGKGVTTASPLGRVTVRLSQVLNTITGKTNQSLSLLLQSLRSGGSVGTRTARFPPVFTVKFAYFTHPPVRKMRRLVAQARAFHALSAQMVGECVSYRCVRAQSSQSSIPSPVFLPVF